MSLSSDTSLTNREVFHQEHRRFFRALYRTNAILALAGLSWMSVSFQGSLGVSTCALLFIVMALGYGAIEWLERNDHTETAHRLYVGLNLASFVAASLAFGVQHPTTVLGLLPIVLAGFLLGPRSAYLVAGACSLGLCASYGVQVTGSFTPLDATTSLANYGVAYVFAFIAVAIFQARAALILSHREDRTEETVEDEGPSLEERVGERTLELHRSNERLRQEITERLESETQLRLARDNAEDAARAKSEFLANMSHEIRTPMNAVIGLTTLLLETRLEPEQSEYVETIKSSGDALLTLINDILDFSKIESGKLSLESQSFEMARAVSESLELLGEKAWGKGVELAHFIDDSCPDFLIGDVTRFKQVLINLISNAVKFTSEGHVMVQISADLEGDVCITKVEVQDTGIGIPEDRLHTLFEAFEQVDASITRKFGGTGLGLAISRRLVRLMGGTFEVESVEGEGSTFRFTVRSGWQVADEQDEHALLGLRALVVDDSAVAVRMLTRQLECWSMEVTSFTSGSKALEFLDQHEPALDLAIVDMRMPEMTGVEFARELQARGLQIPLVLLTGMSMSEDDHDGVFDVALNKPVRARRLQRALTDVFYASTSRGEPESVPVEPEASEIRPLRLLLVEDNMVNQKVACGMLNKLGYKPDIANNGLEGVRAVEANTYDIVFMDVQMPEMDGLTATRTIRARSDLEQPRIVAMTANAMKGDREMCLDAGMDDYIPKPIDFKALAHALEKYAPALATSAALVTQAATPEPVQATGDVLSGEVLQELLDSLGPIGPEIVEDLVQTYLGDTPPTLAALEDAWERQDLEEVRRHAHSMKSSSATLGLIPYSEFWRHMEHATRDGALELVAPELEKMRPQLELARAALERWCQDKLAA